MKWNHLLDRFHKPVPAPPIDPTALQAAHAHVAKERRETDERWHTVRAIVTPLRERSDRNGLAEAILASRRARR